MADSIMAKPNNILAATNTRPATSVSAAISTTSASRPALAGQKVQASKKPAACKKGTPCCPGKRYGAVFLEDAHKAAEHNWLDKAKRVDENAAYELGTAFLAASFENALKDPVLKDFLCKYLKTVLTDHPDFIFKPGGYAPVALAAGATLPCPSKTVGRRWLLEQTGEDCTSITPLQGAKFIALSMQALGSSQDESLLERVKKLTRDTYKNSHGSGTGWFAKQTTYTDTETALALSSIIHSGMRQNGDALRAHSSPPTFLTGYRSQQQRKPSTTLSSASSGQLVVKSVAAAASSCCGGGSSKKPARV